MFLGLLSFSLVTTLLDSMFPTSLHIFFVARLLENILRQAKRQADYLRPFGSKRFAITARCFMFTRDKSLENIPHEEVFRGMQIL